MSKKRVAIIGQGRSGRDIHGEFFKGEENCYFDVVAVVEADSNRRKRAEEEYPGCQTFSDYRELFNLNDIDLVVNASYSHMHYAITKDLLEHKFNVLVEKPFARNYYECCDLINTAKSKGVLLGVFQQTFYAPVYLKAKEVANSGILGDILQVDVKFNGFARRWDWQTLQMKMGGSVYNTGPHPIGIALGLLDFDKDMRVAFSKLDMALTSGDAEDYAKMILVAPNKPVVDVEINSTDAYGDYCIKMQGTKGTYKSTHESYVMKYIVDGENPERPVVAESLMDEEGYPLYCSEDLAVHEDEGTFEGTAFDVGTRDYYKNMYEALNGTKAMDVTAENAADIINVIETVHAQNPLPVKY